MSGAPVGQGGPVGRGGDGEPREPQGPGEPGGPGDSGDPGEPEDWPPPVMTARLAAVVLLLEAFVAFFATLAAVRTVTGPGGLSAGAVLGVGLALSAVCLLAAGLVRRPGGLVVGTVVQGLLVATGAFVPAMVVVGLGFAALWWWLVSIGRRVDADRRRWAAAAAARRDPWA